MLFSGISTKTRDGQSCSSSSVLVQFSLTQCIVLSILWIGSSSSFKKSNHCIKHSIWEAFPSSSTNTGLLLLSCSTLAFWNAGTLKKDWKHPNQRGWEWLLLQVPSVFVSFWLSLSENTITLSNLFLLEGGNASNATTLCFLQILPMLSLRWLLHLLSWLGVDFVRMNAKERISNGRLQISLILSSFVFGKVFQKPH